MRVIAILGVVALAALMTGCAGLNMQPGPAPGFLFEDTKAPLDLDLDKTTLGSKTGEAFAENVLGIVAWGDCSTEAAAKNGKITTINHADRRRFNVLGVYGKFTTVVYGD